MRISVIIPCRNEAGTVEHLLDDLVGQTKQPDEVVVIDSLCTDDTMQRVATYKSKLNIVTSAVKVPGPAPAKNEGIKKASGDYLVLVDADARLPKGFIEKFTQEIDQRKIEAGGFKQKINTTKRTFKIGGEIMNGYMLLLSHTKIPIFFSVCFITRNVYQKIGGFDEKLILMEDYDLAMRAKRAGFKFGIVKSTYFLSNARRYEGPKGLKQVWRGFYGELYRYTHGLRVEKNLYSYEWGEHQKKRQAKD